LDAVIEKREEVVGDDAFEGLAVCEAQFHPESVEFGPAEKSLALGLELVRKLAYEKYRADFGQRNDNVLAIGRKKIDWVGLSQARGVEIAAHGLLVGKDKNDLLVRRGWGSELQVLPLSDAKKPYLRIG